MQPSGADPHRLALVADPQLVDPHTYPDRPWPLSALTVKHTDNYLRRSYSRIQTDLDPQTVFFLGDLFDGGREWGTLETHSPEERYRQYGRLFWVNEYYRFSEIFLREWGTRHAEDRERRDGRRITASLPGNHDQGFGRGIQLPVRNRFQSYFGDGNRIDIIGNHTFISLDTVSLSAQEHRGSNDEIWGPPFDLLNTMELSKNRALTRHLRHIFSLPGTPTEPHETRVRDLQDPADTAHIPTADPYTDVDRHLPTLNFPSILLTHVPLYRDAATPCGPLRESPNPIRIGNGYQYQNTLSGQITDQILEAVNADSSLAHVFSGDDHDYCEVVHSPSKENEGKQGLEGMRLREITVKSISWAMGVRKPGFLLVSLWNPINQRGHPLDNGATVSQGGGGTIQTHLCLLPDQLGILMRYGLLFALSLVVLLVRAAFLVASDADIPDEEPLLPSYGSRREIYKKEKQDPEDNSFYRRPVRANTSSTYENGGVGAGSLSVRPRGYSNRTPGVGIGPPGYTQGESGGNERGDGRGDGYFAAIDNGWSHSPTDDRTFGKDKENDRLWVPKRGIRPSPFPDYMSPALKKRDDPENESGDYNTSTNYYGRKGRPKAGTGKVKREGCNGVIAEFGQSLWRVARVVMVVYLVLWWW